jgi:5-formyltetrahydrofolate cyclo-ligase
MNIETKSQLRRRTLAWRRALTAEEVGRRSVAVHEHLWASGLLARARVVALYAAADNEVATRPLFARLAAEGRTVVLPRVRGRGPEIDFFPVPDWDALVRSRLGVPEPAEGAAVAPEEFDFIAVPGVAFDARGGRLGYGMGCYDRVLGRRRKGVAAVGLGYDFQFVPALPQGPHDVPLTAVALERALVFPGSRENESI